MLHAGPNRVDLKLYHLGQKSGSTRIVIHYQPLLQVPPLHLAIFVARDSPLIIDCPQTKLGAISSAHNSLDAAIRKLRMAAYMWQASLAESFRMQGLERRTFRLDEEWAVDTTTSASFQRRPGKDGMNTIARVRIVQIKKIVAQLRYSRVMLYDLFKEALEQEGVPLDSSANQVVAGMILDSRECIILRSSFRDSGNLETKGLLHYVS